MTDLFLPKTPIGYVMYSVLWNYEVLNQVNNNNVAVVVVWSRPDKTSNLKGLQWNEEVSYVIFDCYDNRQITKPKNICKRAIQVLIANIVQVIILL